jgi:hypothetical protein
MDLNKQLLWLHGVCWSNENMHQVWMSMKQKKAVGLEKLHVLAKS